MTDGATGNLQAKAWPLTTFLTIDFLVAPDIEQNNFPLCRPEHQGKTVGVSQTDRMETLQGSTERMHP